MHRSISSLSVRYPKAVIACWSLLLVISLLVSGKTADRLSIAGFSEPGSESATANERMKDSFQGVYSQQIILVVDGGEIGVEDASFQEAIERIVNESEKDVMASRSLITTAADNRAYVQLDMNASDSEAVKYVGRLKERLATTAAADTLAPFTVQVTGGPGIYHDVGIASQETVGKVEAIGLPIVFILLLFVFRSAVASLLPIVIGGSSILVSTGIIYFLTYGMPLSNLLTNIVTMLGLGIAIDYALILTQRFREELAKGEGKAEAIMTALQTAGRTILFAGLTVALSLAALLAAGNSLFQSIAVGGVVVVIVSVLASVTLLPAILYLLGRHIDRLQLPMFRGGGKKWEGRSARIIRTVLKRPIVFLAMGTLLVGVFLPWTAKMELHIPVGDIRQLPEDSEARRGLEQLKADAGIGAIFPIKLVLERTEGSLRDPESAAYIDNLLHKLNQLPHVSAVWEKAQWNASGTAALIYVFPTVEPYTEEARTLVGEIRSMQAGMEDGMQLLVSGETALGLDYDEKVIGKLPLVIGITVLSAFLLLVITFRSIVVPIKAILLNLFVTLSALGVLVLLFQLGYMPGVFEQALNVNTPVLLFCILFGLSVDYEVILVSRIRESYRQNRSNDKSIEEGFVATAGMINGAAVIMVVVFGVFVFADVQIVKELGVGLAIAILIDALVVRTFLVPATMKLMSSYNWWFPFRNTENRSELDAKSVT